jgi:uncharacterized membrane protein
MGDRVLKVILLLCVAALSTTLAVSNHRQIKTMQAVLATMAVRQ